MRIKLLEVENFRQFSGVKKISMSTDSKKNITVIHGENGSGKTSILNAFKWGFYGHADFETGDENILNEQAIAGAKKGEQLSVRVRIEFEHDNIIYTAKREQTYIKQEGMVVEDLGGGVFELTWTDSKGEYGKSPNPDRHMDQILPEKMHAYFFFNGERIEKLSSVKSGAEISDAVKNLMGLEIVERTATHLLSNVLKVFKNELKQSSTKELASVVEEETKKIDELSELHKTIGVKQQNCIEFDKEIKAIGAQLESIKETVHLEKERKRILNRLAEIKETLEDIVNQRLRLISSQGFLAFIDEAKDKVQDILDENREKGKLPSKIGKQFVDDLLAAGECICSRPLTQGDDYYKSVEALIKEAGSKELEDAVYNTSAEMKSMDKAKDDLFDGLSRLKKNEGKLLKERNELNGKLDTITEQTKDVEDAVDLQEKRETFEQRRSNELISIGGLKTNAEDLEVRTKELAKEGERLSLLDKKADKIRKKIELAEALGKVARALHTAASHKTRTELSGRVNDTFRGIMRKDYWAEINETYDLQIYKNIPNHGKQLVYEKSTGESQIASLSFIGSLVSIARERHKEGLQYFQGGVFPIVMDSPYGQLDDTHKQLVARYIPQLAEQIILMATSSQWKGPVEEECEKFVGKHVSLIHHAPTVEKESRYAKSGSDFEYTEIEEGYHG